MAVGENIGQFKIPTKLLTSKQSLEELLPIMREVVVITTKLEGKQTIYRAFSPRFRKVETGKPVPFYEAWTGENEDGELVAMFREIV